MLSLPSHASDKSYVLARAPQLSPNLLTRDWLPFTEYLSKQTGSDIRLKVYENRSVFELDVKNGLVDLYYGNPGYGVVGHERHGYMPLIRSDAKLLHGILVVRADSNITKVRQLSNETLVFPSESAFAASKFLRSHLRKTEKINFTPMYIGTHDNVYRSVVIGEFIAGGGVERTLNREPSQLREKLRTIYKTPGLKPHPLMAHPKVPAALQKAIQQAVLQLQDSAEGRKMLNKLKIKQPVIPDYHRDYAPILPLVKEMYSNLF